MNVIEFDGVNKRFQLQEGRTLREFMPAFFQGKGWSDPFYALRDVTFSVPEGETFGIVGRNGSGKSTLLKIVAGVMAPSEGSVRVQGRISPLIELGAGFHPDLTGRENIFLNASILGMSNKQTQARFNDIVAFSELEEFIDTPVKRYSSGMYIRLGFAVAVHSDPSILIVDEVLAVGDAGFQEKCFDKIGEFQERGVTMVLVTHALSLVKSLCHRAMLLERGVPKALGRPEEVISTYEELVAQATHAPVGSA